MRSKALIFRFEFYPETGRELVAEGTANLVAIGPDWRARELPARLKEALKGKNKGDPAGHPASFWCVGRTLLLLHHQHRAGGLADDPFGHGAHQELAQAGAAVAPQDDEVHLLGLGQHDNGLVGLPRGTMVSRGTPRILASASIFRITSLAVLISPSLAATDIPNK